jgi:hypothetical protein
MLKPFTNKMHYHFNGGEVIIPENSFAVSISLLKSDLRFSVGIF